MTAGGLMNTAIASGAGPAFIWAFVFDGRGQAQPTLDLPDLAAAREPGFVWLHLDLIHAHTRRWLGGMEPVFGAGVDSLSSPETHPHVDWSGDLLWGSVRDVHREIDKPGEHSGEMRFVLGPALSRHRAAAADAIRACAEAQGRDRRAI